MVVRSGIGIGLQRVGVRRRVAKMGCKWRNFGCAGTDRIPVLCTPEENLFPMSRTGETVIAVKKEIPV
jgi:hypothetical protein